MTDLMTNDILPIDIEEELKRSYLDYAMSVIVGRALPDVRDGLKPVHRRVLYAMHELGNDWNKAYKKSARVVGDVIGKYHPHGDVAVYDTIVRMAQSFSLRYLLVDGQGNFGSVDGDPPAAMRYTEVRMTKLAHRLLIDIDKETVDFHPNYDETEQIPTVLPTRVPNLLVNGSSGIAVGMATNIPPHNLREVCAACFAFIENPEISIEELMQYLPGPDFPTKGIINGRAGIVEAYRTGRGRIYVRARTEIETDEKNSKQSIIVTELPYQVNKARLIEKIAELVKEKNIEGITALRDESDKDGMRILIELRRGESVEIMLNNLYTQTQMQVVFGINMVALANMQPRVFDLKSLLQAFIQHRRETITRRTRFELRKALERAHILEGLAIALVNIDPVIALIKAAGTPQDAKAALLARLWQTGDITAWLETRDKVFDGDTECGLVAGGYQLSSQQAQAILDLRLHRLTGLEQEKIREEYQVILKNIIDLREILEKDARLMQVLKDELTEIVEEFGDERRTEIMSAQHDVALEDLIPPEDVVVTFSREGYAKSQSLTVYEAQHRGGKGKAATTMKAEDVIEKLFVANTHDTLLCFSSAGKVYWIKVYELPQAARLARGRPMVNLLPLSENETITAVLPISAFDENHFVVMVTQFGTIKKTPLTEFSRPRANGIIAVDLSPDEKLIGVAITNGQRDIMLVSSGGKAVRFHESEVRAMGRTAHGVRGIRLKASQTVIALIIPSEEDLILLATQKGYGKCTALAAYPRHGRGGQGVIAIPISERNGLVVRAIVIKPCDELLIISSGGTLIRTFAAQISVIGRQGQGVRLIRLEADENIVDIQRIEEIVAAPLAEAPAIS